MNMYQYVDAVLIGMFLGWLYERTRSRQALYRTACSLRHPSVIG
ncbi:hypothetical protein IV454_00685 [Massilia antarctica]|uniref:MgtC/SapB family protein n=2 Tax=Massilia antarctica TaxID=2765360 RepID=A0AA49A8V1_9BURK|nr:hypothetical protein [Massilia antarctica]QPI50192.1 hypothetical protein IV454_00685 [Massilia antarctica]